MANPSFVRNPLPVASSSIKEAPDFNVKVCAHDPIIAKFCDIGKQHFAAAVSQDLAMEQKSLNQVLAEVLSRVMKERGMSNLRLGRLAKVSPNTIANYMKTDGQFTSKGKEKSAKLTEIERIAKALGVDPLYLLTDPEMQLRRAEAIARAMVSAPAQQLEAAPSKPHRLAA